MRRLGPADHRVMPWKNGGGTTTELLSVAHDDGRPGFLYRVSIADVASDGPFSRFDGYDRHIMMLEGAGMTIDCGEHGVVSLARPFEPKSFSGDWHVVGALTAGPVRDFNVIVDRAQARGTLHPLRMDPQQRFACAASGTGMVWVVHVLSGALEGAGAGETLVLDEHIELTAVQASQLVVATIERVA